MERSKLSRRVVDVALLYEKAVRELDVACALQQILDKRHGLTTEIIQQNYPPAGVLRDLAPSVVVLPFCYQERSNNAYLVRWRQSTFFNLTWEQLFYPGNAAAKTPRGEFAIRHVVHNAWSEQYVELLLAQGVPKEHIFLSGNPAYTLYDEPYRHYFKNRMELASENGLDQTRRWLFFPENYNWAFYEQPMLDQMVRDGQSPLQVGAMRDVVTRSFELAMGWCARLLERKDIELIVRPRPATPVEVFRKRVEEVLGRIPSRMLIAQTATVRDWILASDVVVSSYSTSLVEASIAGRPAYILEPVPLPEALRQDWHALAPRITSEEAFVAAAAGYPAVHDDGGLARWARTTLMGRGDSILLIADELARIRHRQVPVPDPPPWRSVTLPSRRRLPSRVVFEYRSRIKPLLAQAAEQVAAESREDVAAAREIPERVQRWASVLDGYGADTAPTPA